MQTDFKGFGLRPTLIKALEELEHVQPTPVQDAVIPHMLEGRDVIAQARTGTGKTGAFALPALQNLDHRSKAVQVLVLSPTRELALQVGKAFQAYAKFETVKVLTIYGGASYGYQKGNLRDGVSVVVGTPGRLRDLVRQGNLKLNAVRLVVLDEADEMLSMGFLEEVEEILALLPEQRQTALFSATLPKGIKQLASLATKDPERVNLSKEVSTKTVDLACFVVRESDKIAAITRIFEMEKVQTCLIFCRTRAQTSVMAAELSRRGIPAEALSGALDQESREKVLKRFRDQTFTVLVATDVAARGLDIDHLSHVINMDLPQSPDTFVHRIGRTGRAGRKGIAFTLVTPREEWKLKRVERAIKRTIEVRKVPTRREIMQARLDALYAKLDKWLGSSRCKKELDWVDGLVAAGHEPRQIAAAALKLAAASEKQVPIAEMEELSFSTSKPQGKKKKTGKKHRLDKGSVQLIADIGKRHSVKPKELVSVLTKQGKVPNKLIGSIRISKSRSFIDVQANCVDRVLEGNGSYRIGKHTFTFKVD